jgi:hypothetical protein
MAASSTAVKKTTVTLRVTKPARASINVDRGHPLTPYAPNAHCRRTMAMGGKEGGEG